MAKTHIPQRLPKAAPRLPPQFRLLAKPAAGAPLTVDPSAERDVAAALFSTGRINDAQAAFEAMLARNARDVYALYHLTLIHFLNKRYTEGLCVIESAIVLAPAFAPNRYGRAMLLQAQGHFKEALKDYDEALRLQPDYPEALLNSGVVLREMFQHHAALERFERVLATHPADERALANAAMLLGEMDQPERSIPMFERLVQLNPKHPYGLGMLAYERLRSCDWTDLGPLTQAIVQGLAADQMVCRPFAVMSMPTTAQDQYRSARIFAQQRFPKAARSLWNGEHYGHTRLRIGYVSPDFREHPVSHLMSGIIESHDRSRFEVIAISVGANDGSRFRARLEKAFDQFIDMAGQGALQIAQRIRELEIDVLIDLAGYTSDGRPDVFAYRAAPIQASFLGYPGTLGTDYYDYIIADRHVIPPEHQAHYAEKVAYLPHTYLPTDDTVKASERTPTRAECGLPETGAVLCAFSHNFKMHPAVFARWMNMLRQLPGSVLWLNSRSSAIQTRLRAAAQAAGVDPARLVFAGRVPAVEDHLARYRLADLFLDTWPYNAHTTAADALMMGLPVVTFMGDAFPARVAGSLLHAIGLPELITHSLDDYEAKVVALVQDPARLQAVKARLVANKATHALFNTERFCRHLEAVYLGLGHATGSRALEALASKACTAESPEPTQTQTPALSQDDDLERAVTEVLDHLAAHRYDTSALARLTAVRTRCARRLLEIPAAELAGCWKQALGRSHLKLLESGVAQIAAVPDDAPLLQALAERLRTPATPDHARSASVAQMLFQGPHWAAQGWPSSTRLSGIPPELLEVSLLYLFTAPTIFREPGEADVYERYFVALLSELVEGLTTGHDRGYWVSIALNFVNRASMIPLYFSNSTLKLVMALRARTLEYLIGSQTNSPGLDFEFAEMRRPRIRLGVLAAHFRPQTETYATLPVYCALDRSRFEVILISQIGFGDHPLERHCQGFADRCVSLSGTLMADVGTVRGLDLDALWVGTNLTATMNYVAQLSVHRLARLQMTGGCSPATTGFRHMDLFVSGRATEPADAASHYTERLALVNGPAHCFDMAESLSGLPAAGASTRASLGIADEAPLFVSGANFFKIIPELLDAWVDLLRQTPGSRLLLFPFNPNWTSRYPMANFFLELTRRAVAGGVAANRFVIVPPLPDRAGVLGLLALADVYLDSFPYSGMTSLLDPLQVGLPIVAVQGHCQRQRMSASALRSLGLQDWLMLDATAYVARAVQLAGSAAMRGQMREALAAASRQTPKFLDVAWFSQEIGRLILAEVATALTRSDGTEAAPDDVGLPLPSPLRPLAQEAI